MNARASLGSEAETRIVRIIAFSLGGAAIVYCALSLAAILSQSPAIQSWWTWPALTLTFGAPLLLGVVARWANLHAIRAFAAFIAIGYLVVMLTLTPALVAGHLPLSTAAPWIIGVSTPAAIAGAIAWHPAIVWSYVAAVSTLVGVNRELASPQLMLDVAGQDSLVALFMSALFVSLALATIRAGRLLDSTAESAAREASFRSAMVAQQNERTRAEGLIHDGVLATLLLAGNEDARIRQAASSRAAAALTQLAQYSESSTRARDLTPRELVWKLQAAATETAPETGFDYVVEGQLAIPDAVARAITEASVEALGNSVRHASRPDRAVTRVLHVEVSQSAVRVNILDDGVGFDPQAVSPSRLGIAVSISARLDVVAGGRANVVSKPGDGTRVFLEWVVI